MFDVPGRHTFFLAVDSAFQVKPKQKRYLFPLFPNSELDPVCVINLHFEKKQYIAPLECLSCFLVRNLSLLILREFGKCTIYFTVPRSFIF
jgi:hypothetical protein